MSDWLKDYRELQDQIKYLELNYDKTKRELKRWENPRDLGKYKLEADSLGANVEEKLEVIEYELAHKMNDLIDMDLMIRSFDGLEHKIIYRKHVEGKTLEAIAAELNYSTNYIKMRHAQSMRMIGYHKKVSSK